MPVNGPVSAIICLGSIFMTKYRNVSTMNIANENTDEHEVMRLYLSSSRFKVMNRTCHAGSRIQTRNADTFT